MGFKAGVASPANLGGNVPSRPSTWAKLIVSSCDANADHAPVSALIEVEKSTANDFEFSLDFSSAIGDPLSSLPSSPSWEDDTFLFTLWVEINIYG